LTSGAKTYKEEVDLSNLPKGIYIVTLKSYTGRIFASKRVIKLK